MRTRLSLGLIFLTLAIAQTGCSQQGSGGETSQADLALADPSQKGPLSDEAFAALLAQTPGPITEAQGDKLLLAGRGGTSFTTVRLKMLNDFVKDAFDRKVTPNQAYIRLGTQIEVIYWGLPRDVASTPADFGGQKLFGQLLLDPDNDGDDPSPFKLRVSAASANDYDLTMTIREHQVRVHVPRASDAKATAKLITAAIHKDAGAIVESSSGPDGFKSIGANRGDFDDSTDMDAKTSKSTVVITLGIDG